MAHLRETLAIIIPMGLAACTPTPQPRDNGTFVDLSHVRPNTSYEVSNEYDVKKPAVITRPTPQEHIAMATAILEQRGLDMTSDSFKERMREEGIEIGPIVAFPNPPYITTVSQGFTLTEFYKPVAQTRFATSPTVSYPEGSNLTLSGYVEVNAKDGTTVLMGLEFEPPVLATFGGENTDPITKMPTNTPNTFSSSTGTTYVFGARYVILGVRPQGQAWQPYVDKSPQEIGK